MAKSKLVQANQKIVKEVTGGYKKIEEAVVGGYKKIEDAFVAQYLTHEGESVEEAKKRLHTEQEERASKGMEQYTTYTAPGCDYARLSQEQAMEYTRRAQKMAGVPGQTKNIL